MCSSGDVNNSESWDEQVRNQFKVLEVSQMSHLWQGKEFCWGLSPSRKTHGHLEFHLPLSLSLRLFTLELSSFYALERLLQAGLMLYSSVPLCPKTSTMLNALERRRALRLRDSPGFGRPGLIPCLAHRVLVQLWANHCHSMCPEGTEDISKIRTSFGVLCNSCHWLLKTQLSSRHLRLVCVL